MRRSHSKTLTAATVTMAAVMLGSLAVSACAPPTSSPVSKPSVPATSTIATPTAPTSEASATLGGADAESSESSAAERAEVKMNAKATADQWQVRITGLTFATQAGGATAPAGMRLAVLSVTVTNSGSSARTLHASAFRLSEASGTVLPAAKTSSTSFLPNLPQPIAARATVGFRLAFVVPMNAKSFELEFAPAGRAGGAVPLTLGVE
jgi:hypothetical protein